MFQEYNSQVCWKHTRPTHGDYEKEIESEKGIGVNAL